MPEVNWIAVGMCAVSSLVLGAIWYSPALFARQWQTAAGLSEEQASSGNMGVIFGMAFLLSLAAAAVFAMFLGKDMSLGAATAAGSLAADGNAAAALTASAIPKSATTGRPSCSSTFSGFTSRCTTPCRCA